MNADETRKAEMKEARAMLRSMKLGLEWLNRNVNFKNLGPDNWQWTGDYQSITQDLAQVHERLGRMIEVSK